ncbi:MAG: hypothetical protein IKE66_08285 [Hyphomicrobium sp.]|nr:hypothetical protein [Hyphomicrobium sp.]
MSDDLIECEGHGQQRPAFVCQHLAETQPDDEPIGFHWNCEGGDLLANCDDCEAEASDDGFLPDDYFEENFVVICRMCFVEMAAVNDVSLQEIEQAEKAAAS